MLLLEVFTQRNFVADFFRQKLNFTGKNSKIAFRATLWGLRGNVHGSSTARWKGRGRILILVLIGRFSELSRLRRYEQILVEIVLLGWVKLSSNFREKRSRPPMTVGVRILESLSYHVALFARFYV